MNLHSVRVPPAGPAPRPDTTRFLDFHEWLGLYRTPVFRHLGWDVEAGAVPDVEVREVILRAADRAVHVQVADVLARLEQQYVRLMRAGVPPRDAYGLCFYVTRREYRALREWVTEIELAEHGLDVRRASYRGYPLRVVLDEGELL